MQITTTRAGLWRRIMLSGLRWLGWVYGLVSLATGVTLADGAAFLLHLRWDISVIVGLTGTLAVVFEGCWRVACREKDALDPKWRTKYGKQRSST